MFIIQTLFPNRCISHLNISLARSLLRYDTCKTREVVINQTINCEFRRVQGYDRSKDEAHLASKERRADLGESR